MTTIFLEYIPDKFKDKLKELNDYSIVALTPKACYELDKMDIEYDIPDNFYFPEEVDIKHLFEEVSKVEFPKDISFIYLIQWAHSFRAMRYWAYFISSYFIDKKIGDIFYFGNEYKILLEVLRNKFSNERVYQA